MIQLNLEVAKAQSGEYVSPPRQFSHFHEGRRRSNGVDIALVELAEPAPGRPVRTPDGLNLVPLEKLRQLVLVLGDDAREGDGQVVPEREVGFAAGLVLAAAKNLENELVAFVAVLPQQRVDVFESRCLERLES